MKVVFKSLQIFRVGEDLRLCTTTNLSDMHNNFWKQIKLDILVTVMMLQTSV